MLMIPLEILILKGDKLLTQYDWATPNLVRILTWHRAKSHTIRIRWDGLEELTPIIISGNYIYPGIPKEIY